MCVVIHYSILYIIPSPVCTLRLYRAILDSYMYAHMFVNILVYGISVSYTSAFGVYNYRQSYRLVLFMQFMVYHVEMNEIIKKRINKFKLIYFVNKLKILLEIQIAIFCNFLFYFSSFFCLFKRAECYLLQVKVSYFGYYILLWHKHRVF